MSKKDKKEEKIVELMKLVLTLTDSTYRLHIYTMKARETNMRFTFQKSFTSHYKDSINKEELFQVQTMHRNAVIADSGSISFYVFCFNDDKHQLSVKALHDSMEAYFKKIENRVTLMGEQLFCGQLDVVRSDRRDEANDLPEPGKLKL